MTLTEEQLRTYIESAGKATPGEWLRDDADIVDASKELLAEVYQNVHDAAFIAASRTIGPAAAEEVLRLREALKALAIWIEIWGKDVDCNLVPTSSSLSRAADEVEEALKGNDNADA